MNRRLSHAVRRVRQTFEFDNPLALLGGMAGKPVLGRPEELVFETSDGLRVICPNQPGARVPVYEVFAEDAYRLPWFTAGLPDDAVAVDIGAHIGCFALAVAAHRPAARVHSFEASPSTAAVLVRNIETNGLAARVTGHHMAVGAEMGTIEFADNNSGSSLNGLTAPAGSTLIQVPCVSIAAAFELAGGRVDLVKIDTEGAEYDMVLACAPSTWADVQRVVLEYHDVTGHAWKELEDFFTRAGFQVVAHEPISARQGTAWLSRTPLG